MLVCVHARQRFAVEESNEFNDTMLFIKWLPDAEEPACRFQLYLPRNRQKGVCGFVRGV